MSTPLQEPSEETFEKWINEMDKLQRGEWVDTAIIQEMKEYANYLESQGEL